MKENYKAIIDDRVKTIGRLTCYSTSIEEAAQNYSGKYLYADYNKNYGGYKLVLINCASMAEENFSFRNSTRLTAKAFIEMLDAMIFGLEYGKEV